MLKKLKTRAFQILNYTPRRSGRNCGDFSFFSFITVIYMSICYPVRSFVRSFVRCSLLQLMIWVLWCFDWTNNSWKAYHFKLIRMHYDAMAQGATFNFFNKTLYFVRIKLVICFNLFKLTPSLCKYRGRRLFCGSNDDKLKMNYFCFQYCCYAMQPPHFEGLFSSLKSCFLNQRFYTVFSMNDHHQSFSIALINKGVNFKIQFSKISI